MNFLGARLVLAGAAATILGLVACSASITGEVDSFVGGPGGSGTLCTEDAGALTPIGPQGCPSNQTVVYQKPRASTGGSAIATGSGGVKTPQAAMVAACTDTKCAPGQVAVVTYQAVAPSVPFVTDSGAPDAVTPFVDDGGTAAAEGGDATATLGDSSSVADAADDASPDGAPLSATDASDDASSSGDDAGVMGIPCGAVVTCVDAPATCPPGQSPSYAPSGKWHCMPSCDPGNTNLVVITYGGTYGSTTICANAPPTQACPGGQVWTWDYQDEEWVCAPKCNNGLYDQHTYGGQTVCVPC